jgi:hypothetical protein
MHVPPGWYTDPVAPGLLRYWTGREWAAATAPVWPSVTHQTPAQGTSWTADPWVNPYAPAPAAVPQPNRRTAVITTLAVIIGLLGMVVSAEVTHALTVRHDTASAAADGTGGTPLTVPNSSPQVSTGRQLPVRLAGLILNPQSQSMAHHLTQDAETELTRRGGTITLGYYGTSSENSKVFLEIVDGTTETSAADAPPLRLSQLEVGFNGAVMQRIPDGPASTWSRVPSGPDTVMYCRTATDYKTPVRACAFVQGSTVGIIGVYQPTAADNQLIEEVRTAITGS